MKVYRLQTVDGHGPFRHQAWVGEHLVDHLEPHEQYPTMMTSQADRAREMLSGGKCFAWLTRELFDNFIREGRLGELHNKGHRLYVYNTFDYVIFPDGQVIFDRDEATVVEVIDLIEEEEL